MDASRKTKSTSESSGFTLLELVIYSALAIVIGAPILTMVLTSSRYVSELDSMSRVQEHHRSSLYRWIESYARPLRCSAS